MNLFCNATDTRRQNNLLPDIIANSLKDWQRNIFKQIVATIWNFENILLVDRIGHFSNDFFAIKAVFSCFSVKEFLKKFLFCAVCIGS